MCHCVVGVNTAKKYPKISFSYVVGLLVAIFFAGFQASAENEEVGGVCSVCSHLCVAAWHGKKKTMPRSISRPLPPPPPLLHPKQAYHSILSSIEPEVENLHRLDHMKTAAYNDYYQSKGVLSNATSARAQVLAKATTKCHAHPHTCTHTHIAHSPSHETLLLHIHKKYNTHVQKGGCT